MAFNILSKIFWRNICKFRTKSLFNCSRAVFMKSLYFFLLKTDFLSFYVFSKKLKLWGNFSETLGQNICRLFAISAKFPITTSETKLHFYHQKVDMQKLPHNLSSEFRQTFQTNFKENPWNWWQGHRQPPERQILTDVLQNWEKSIAKRSMGKPILLNFKNLFQIFCSRLHYHRRPLLTAGCDFKLLFGL